MAHTKVERAGRESCFAWEVNPVSLAVLSLNKSLVFSYRREPSRDSRHRELMHPAKATQNQNLGLLPRPSLIRRSGSGLRMKSA